MRKKITKNLHSCAPTKLKPWPLELQLIFQDHGSTATDYFKCHYFFFPPLKRLNHLNVLGIRSEKPDISGFFFNLFFYFISFNEIGPEMFVSLSTLGPDYSNFLLSPRSVLRLPPPSPPWINPGNLSLCQAAVFWQVFFASSSFLSPSLPPSLFLLSLSLRH